MPTLSNQESKAARIHNPDGFQPEKARNLSSVLNALLAGVFALYIKTRNFHRHMSGPHFRNHHLRMSHPWQPVVKVGL